MRPSLFGVLICSLPSFWSGNAPLSLDNRNIARNIFPATKFVNFVRVGPQNVHVTPPLTPPPQRPASPHSLGGAVFHLG